MNFFKGFLSSCLGALVAMMLILAGIIMIISMSGGEEIIVKENSVLRLDLDVPIIEIERDQFHVLVGDVVFSERLPQSRLD